MNMNKKSWILLIVVLAVACVAAWLYFTPFRRHYRAEELLPEKTLVFVDIPNTTASRERFAGTALGKIWAEPEIRAFLERPLQAARQILSQKSKERAIFQGVLQMLATCRGEAFLACVDVSISPRLDPLLIAGFDPGDQHKQAERALADLIARCRSLYPEILIEKREFESGSCQVLVSGGKTRLAFARVGNFFLFSREEEALQQVILRAKNKKKARLMDAPAYALHREKHPARDVLIFLNSQPVLDRVKPLLALQPALWTRLDSMLPYGSFLGVSIFKQGGMESHSWVSAPGAPKPKTGPGDFQKCERRSLEAAGADTLLYGTLHFNPSKWVARLKASSEQNQGVLRRIFERILDVLSIRGIQPDEFLFSQIGPELALLLEWNESEPPLLSVLIQMRNLEKFKTASKKFFETLKLETGTSPGSSGKKSQKAPTQKPLKRLVYSLKKGGSSAGISPAFAFSDSWAIISFSPAAAEKILRTLDDRDFLLAARPEFQAAASRFGSDGHLFVYCDQKRLFERIYNLAGPMASFVDPLMPSMRNYVDLSRLPPTETVSRHLFPSVHVHGADGNGDDQSSFGPINLSGLTLGVIGAILWPEDGKREKGY